MQTTTVQKTDKITTLPSARALAVIDLGNGQVKALCRAPGTDGFKQVSFPSYAAKTEQSHSGCLRVFEGKALATYIIGAEAAEIPLSHTGKSDQGKVQNARLLVLEALRQAFGIDHDCLHVDIIFTSPSNKAYGSEISAQLQGVHAVTVPRDSYLPGSEAKSYTVNIHRAIPQLEGHFAFSSLNLKDDAWLIDIGNRTVIATKLKADGRIVKRSVFGGVGVRGMAERIAGNESLAGYIKEFAPERIIDFLFANPPKDAAALIADDVAASLAEPLAFIGADAAKRYLIGGGAGLPGVAAAAGAKPVRDAQWANIRALSAAATQILGA